MAKITIPDIASQFASQEALNARFTQVENELNDKVLYRDNPDGEPNAMAQELDMNSKRIINLPEPVNPNDAARLQDIAVSPIDPGSIIATQAEAYTLAAGQTTVVFSAYETAGSSFNISGPDTDDSRLVLGRDFSVTNSTTILLTQSYPAGSIIQLLRNVVGGEITVVEPQLAYDTVAQMELDTSVVGSIIQTKGYYAAGDGGGASYLVTTTTAVDGAKDHPLASGNIAVFQKDSTKDQAKYRVLPNHHIQAPSGERFIVRGVTMFDYLFVSYEARSNWLYREGSPSFEPDKDAAGGISRPTYNADISWKSPEFVESQLKFAQSTGVNLIRVAVEPAIVKASVPYVDPADGQTYPSDVDMLNVIIAKAASLGMVVQLQQASHDVPLSDCVEFARWMKDTYWEHQNVWINPANEINGTNANVNDPVVWEADMTQYVNALREDITGQPAGTKFLNPLCIDPPGWATRIDLVDTVLKTNTTFSEAPNLIVNVHFYPQAIETDFFNDQFITRTPQWIDYIGQYCIVIAETGIDNEAGRLDPDLDPGTPSVDPTGWANVQVVAKEFLTWADEQTLYGNQAGASPLGDLNGVIGFTWGAYITGLATHADNSMYRQDGTITTWGGIFKNYSLSPPRNLLTARRALGSESNGSWGTGDIGVGVVTNDRLAIVPTATIKGRESAGTGVVEDLTSEQVLKVISSLNAAGRVGAASVGTPTFQFEDRPGAAAGAMGIASGASTNIMAFYNRGTALLTGTIVGDGTTGVNYTTVSDERLKENIVDVTSEDALAAFDKLRPVSANWKSHPDEKHLMFIAHEAQEAVPAAVTGEHNEVNEDGEAIYQTVDYGRVTPLLAAVLKSALERIDALEELLRNQK